jgi:hypothetical protein
MLMPTNRIGRVFSGGSVFWLWIEFFRVESGFGSKIIAIPDPWIVADQKLWPMPTHRIGRVFSDRSGDHAQF